MLTFSTSSNFLTIDYLIDLVKVFSNLRGGSPPLPAIAHALRPGRLRSLPLRMCRGVCIEVDGSIAAKQLLYIRTQVILIISAKTHRPQLIVVGRRVVAVGHRRPPVPQRPVEERSEAKKKKRETKSVMNPKKKMASRRGNRTYLWPEHRSCLAAGPPRAAAAT